VGIAQLCNSSRYDEAAGLDFSRPASACLMEGYDDGPNQICQIQGTGKGLSHSNENDTMTNTRDSSKEQSASNDNLEEQLVKRAIKHFKISYFTGSERPFCFLCAVSCDALDFVWCNGKCGAAIHIVCLNLSRLPSTDVTFNCAVCRSKDQLSAKKTSSDSSSARSKAPETDLRSVKPAKHAKCIECGADVDTRTQKIAYCWSCKHLYCASCALLDLSSHTGVFCCWWCSSFLIEHKKAEDALLAMLVISQKMAQDHPGVYNVTGEKALQIFHDALFHNNMPLCDEISELASELIRLEIQNTEEHDKMACADVSQSISHGFVSEEMAYKLAHNWVNYKLQEASPLVWTKLRHSVTRGARCFSVSQAAAGKLIGGFITADFVEGGHPTQEMILGTLLQIKQSSKISKLYIFLISTLRENCTLYIELSKMFGKDCIIDISREKNDGNAALKIYEKEPHFVIYGCGHTGARRGIIIALEGFTNKFYRRELQDNWPHNPPVIIHWPGYPGQWGGTTCWTMGDGVFFSDQIRQHHGLSRSLSMSCYHTTGSLEAIRTYESTSLHNMKSHGFEATDKVICFNGRPGRFCKKTQVFYANLLRGNRTRKVLLIWHHAGLRAMLNVLIGLLKLEVDPSQVVFGQCLPPMENLLRIKNTASVCVDRLEGWSMHSQASSALAVGKAVVSKVQDTAVASVAASILTNVGLECLIGKDEEELAAITNRILDNDSELSAQIKDRLSPEELEKSIVFNSTKAAEEFVKLVSMAVRAGSQEKYISLTQPNSESLGRENLQFSAPSQHDIVSEHNSDLKQNELNPGQPEGQGQLVSRASKFPKLDLIAVLKQSSKMEAKFRTQSCLEWTITHVRTIQNALQTSAPSLNFCEFCGSGAYGTVVSGTFGVEGRHSVAIKLEIQAGTRTCGSALKNEALIYHKVEKHPASSRTQILPHTVQLLEGCHFFCQIQLDQSYMASVLCMERTDPWLEPLRRRARCEFISESKILPEWIQGLQKIYEVYSVLHDNGIAHLDPKFEHIRHGQRGPVLVDMGTAWDSDCQYTSKKAALKQQEVRTSEIGRITFTVASQSRCQRRYVGPTNRRPGTPCFRAPESVNSFDDARRADCWSLGVISLAPVLDIPGKRQPSVEFENELYQVTSDRNFPSFLAFFLHKNKGSCAGVIHTISRQDPDQMTDESRNILQLLKLGFAFLNPTAADRLNPKDALKQFNAFLARPSI